MPTNVDLFDETRLFLSAIFDKIAAAVIVKNDECVFFFY